MATPGRAITDRVAGDRNGTVFDDAGRWLGDVAMPGALLVSEIGANYLPGVAKDELGVEYVRLHAQEE
jgi:hypothetical protein